ncbi:outer membrane protein [Histidinibacterium aquaticum]|uniref:Porin family protein n=1 Tax=Histidinibacterium aquaticum TaxID=2613962 RepID=A0A5J5GLA4_9RHOB|nr:porin [Histidinibacterium aquaticum]KAA9009069.1 porin family protein [Histidinibacterium aquaticum]
MKTLTISALALVAAGPLSAAGLDQPAADPVVPVQPVAPAPVVSTGGDWSGFYGGAQLGYGQIEAEDAAPSGDAEGEGATYGLHAGYLYDFGAVVAGAEVDYDWTNIEDEDTGTEVDDIARAKLRLGYDAGRILPYVTAGAAMAETSGGLSGEDTGRFAGVGMEYRVRDGVRVGAEVLKHEFEDFDDSGVDVSATTANARVSFEF